MAEQDTMTGRDPLPCTDSSCSAASETCTAATNVTTPDDEEKIDQSAKRGWFEDAVKERLNIPSGYVKVAVLVLRWHEDIDEYAKGHTSEVSYFLHTFHRQIPFEMHENSLHRLLRKSPGAKLVCIQLMCSDRIAGGSIQIAIRLYFQ
jgi:hypothetical protein